MQKDLHISANATDAPSVLMGACTALAPAPPQPVERAYLLQNLRREAIELAALGEHPQISTLTGFHLVVSRLHAIAAVTRQCVEAGISCESVRSALQKARDVCSVSPFMRHITEWPRGYPGDFQIVDYICTQQNCATPGTVAYWIEEYSLSCGMAQQHRNKVQRQAYEILRCAQAKASQHVEPRILILACGSSPDLQLVQQQLSEFAVNLVAVDHDPEAITVTRERLPALVPNLSFVCGSALRRITALSRLGPFDLVVAGGLFDYLDEAAAVLLIRAVCTRLLSDSGQFFFTNIAPGNPWEDLMKYLANWALIDRSERDIEDLISKAGLETSLVRFERDPTRLTMFTTINRPQAPAVIRVGPEPNDTFPYHTAG